MSPSGSDLSVLRAVLTDHAVDIDSTSDVGAGVALAGVSLAQYDFAVAVIPADHERHEASLPAIYIEIGVAVARGLPLMVIAGTSIPASPALAGATTIVMTELGNEEALRLHLGVVPPAGAVCDPRWSSPPACRPRPLPQFRRLT